MKTWLDLDLNFIWKLRSGGIQFSNNSFLIVRLIFGNLGRIFGGTQKHATSLHISKQE